MGWPNRRALHFLILLTLVSGGIGSGPGRDAHASRAGHSPIGPTPANCPLGPAPRFVPSLYMATVGSAPVWAVGFRPNVPLHIGHQGEGVLSPHGWPVKIPWLERRSYTGNVTITARAWPHGEVLWWQDPDSMRPRPAAPFLALDPHHPDLHPFRPDPRHPGKYITNWNVNGFASLMFIPRAGCYVVEARWPGGSWSNPFAAGA